MTNVATKTLIALLFAFASIAVAGGKTTFSSALLAADQYQPVKSQLRQLERDGARIESGIPNAYRYLIAPEGDYDWGTVVYRVESSAGDMSLQRTLTTITVYIRYIESANGYVASGYDVQTSTVY